MLKKIRILLMVLPWVLASTAQGMDRERETEISQEKRGNPKKEAVYFAQRVKNLPPDCRWPITPEMTCEDLTDLSLKYSLDRGNYFHSGPFLFSDRNRPDQDKLPAHLRSGEAVKMVFNTLKRSTVFVAKIAPKSFGTFVEIGIAAQSGNIAVYVFLDTDLDLLSNEAQDFWFPFHAAATTAPLWKEEHFSLGIMPFKITLADYRKYVDSFTAPFLRKNQS